MVPADRGRQVLDAGTRRAQAARRPGHPDLLRGRPDRLPRSNRGDLPKDDRPNLHRSPHPTEPALRPASRVRPGRQGPQADLHRDRRGRRLAGARDLRREVGQAIPANRAGLAGRLGARHPLHGLRARGPPRDLHDKRHRSAQPAATQGNQDQGALPDRGLRPQADLPRDPQRRPAMDPHPSLDQGATRVQDPVRRPAPRQCNLTATTRQPSTQGLELTTGQPPTHLPGHPPPRSWRDRVVDQGGDESWRVLSADRLAALRWVCWGLSGYFRP